MISKTYEQWLALVFDVVLRCRLSPTYDVMIVRLRSFIHISEQSSSLMGLTQRSDEIIDNNWRLIRGSSVKLKR